MSRQGGCHELERPAGGDQVPAGDGDGEGGAPKRASRGRLLGACARDEPTGVAAAGLRLLAAGLVACAVYLADGVGLCADDACGAFESLRPEVVGFVLLLLQAVYRLLACLYTKLQRKPRGAGVSAGAEEIDGETGEAKRGAPGEDETAVVEAGEAEAAVREAPAEGVGERGRRGPTPSEVIAAAHRPDAIVVPPSWCAPVESIDAMGPGDCGGFDPKALIIWPDGTLQVPSPCPPGGSEGCLCTALEVWIARARRSLEAEVAPSAPGAETDDEPR